MSEITKGERTELRSVIRQQFKVLRAEVIERQAELSAQLEDEVARRFAQQDKEWNDLMFQINEAAREANRKINDLLYEADHQVKDGTERWLINLNSYDIGKLRKGDGRTEFKQRGHAHLNAQVKGALLRLDRDEADLLRALATTAMESEEARTFLTRIPTVGELVSAARIAELESSYEMGT